MAEAAAWATETQRERRKLARRMLDDPKFMSGLAEASIDFSQKEGKIIDHFTERQVKQVSAFLQRPDFNSESMQSLPKAGVALFNWVLAKTDFYFKKKKTATLSQHLYKVQAELNRIKHNLAECQKTLEQSDDERHTYQPQREQLDKEQGLLEAEIKCTKTKLESMRPELDKTEELLKELKERKSDPDRWRQSIAKLAKYLNGILDGSAKGAAEMFMKQNDQTQALEWLCRTRSFPFA